MTHLLKRYADDERIPEADAAILRFMQPVNMTSMQFGEALITKAIRVEDVYDKGTFIETFKEVHESIHHNLRGYCATHLYADLTNLAFQAPWLLVTQSGSSKTKPDDSSCRQV